MTQTLLFILVVIIGCLYSIKYGKGAKSKIENYKATSEEQFNDDSMLLYEGDFLMIEIMPSKNFNFAQEELGFVKEKESIKINTLEIAINRYEVILLLKKIGMKEYNKLTYVGIGEPQLIENSKTKVFGSLSSAIFFEFKDNFVEYIWFASYNRKQIKQTKIIEGLNLIGKKFDLIMVDFNDTSKEIINLKKLDEIENYFEKKNEVKYFG